MKQNERLLVYAVSGFLGLILVVAVLFRPSAGDQQAPKTPGLAQILNQEVAAKDADVGKPAPGAASAAQAADAAFPGVPAPVEVAPQPLAAPAPKPVVAADLVAQQLGLSRRERNVRFVRAKPNDSLDSLVRRWCGARDPYLAETKSLNEELVMLRAGQEVAVPWVDDEVLLLAIEASKPKALAAQAPAAAVGNSTGGAPAPMAASPAAAVTNVPMPTLAPAGTVPSASSASNPSAAASGAAPAAAGTSYTVKAGDSLWRIADRTYGRKNADKMVAAIKQANPGLGDSVREGQKIVLPAAK